MNVGTSVYESDNGFGLTGYSREMQGCKAAVIFCVNVDAFVDENDGDFGLTG